MSVVIPLYNKEPHIRRALESVLAQTYRDFEVIVVDDGSTDGGAAVVEAMSDPRIRLIRQANKGVSAARNRAIAEARGDTIAFLDADDEWYDCHLANIDVLARSFPDAGLFGSAYETVLDNGAIARPECAHIPKDSNYVVIPDYFKAASCGQSPIHTSSMAAPKSVLFDVGCFPEGIHIGEDESLIMRIALKHPVAFTWIPGARYRKDATSRASRDRSLLATRVDSSASIADYRLLRDSGLMEDGGSLTDYIDKRLLSDAVRLYQLLGDRGGALRHLALVTGRAYRRNARKWKVVVRMPHFLFRVVLRLKLVALALTSRHRCRVT
jgi:glycosyltransferase involved in cell wall biosynthesis